jgi:hypothetical protein
MTERSFCKATRFSQGRGANLTLAEDVPANEVSGM